MRNFHHYIAFFIFINCQISIVNCSLSQDRRPDGSQFVVPYQPGAQSQSEEQLAMQFYSNREYDKAAEIFERLYEQNPTGYHYLYLYFCLVETREFKKAEKLVKKQQKLEPGSLKFMVDLGYISYREGNANASRKQYEEALRKLTPDQQQISDLANAFITKGENDFAIRTYEKGRQLMTNSYPFSFELALVYERLGDFNKAIQEYLYLVEVNPAYLNTVQDRLQNLLVNDIANEKNETFRKIILERVQKDPDKTYYAELLWWYSIQRKDFDLALIQAKSLDRRLKESGQRVFQLAQLALSNDRYTIAEEAFGYLVSRGPSSLYYLPARIERINARYLKTISSPSPPKKQLEELEKEFVEELQKSGNQPQSISLMKNLAQLQAFWLGKSGEAIELLNRAIEMAGITSNEKAEVKLELADLYLFTDDVWEASLLYQQVYKDFKDDATGQLAKYKNTRLSFYIGEFSWAKAQLDILKAATTKLIANDAMALSLLISENFDPDSGTIALGIYSRADLLDFRNEEELALATLDSIFLLYADHPILDDALYKKAEIRIKQGKYSEADSLLAKLVMDFPEGVLSDEALMRRAKLHENQLHDAPAAMKLYKDLFENYPGSIFVTDARKRFRHLRGDNL